MDIAKLMVLTAVLLTLTLPFKYYNKKEKFYKLTIKHLYPKIYIEYKINKSTAERILQQKTKKDLKFYDYKREKMFVIKDRKYLAYSLEEL